MSTICSIEGCEKPAKTRGWCLAHYERWHKHGDPLGGRPTYASATDRFWAKTKLVGGCLVWQGGIKPNGYGKFNVGNRTYNAHRWGYEDKIGPIPAGLDLDHLCRNRACVNPDHLEPVTRSVNLNRGLKTQAMKTHCPKGHPYDEANTYVWKSSRACRTCDRERRRKR